MLFNAFSALFSIRSFPQNFVPMCEILRPFKKKPCWTKGSHFLDPPDTVMVHPQHTLSTDPAMPCPGWPHQAAHRTLRSFHFTRTVWLAGNPIQDSVPNNVFGPNKPRASLGPGKQDKCGDHAHCHSSQLAGIYGAPGQDFSDEQEVHVGQWEERQCKEKQRASLPAVSKVVIPEHQDRDCRQDRSSQHAVQRCHTQQNRKQKQGREHREVYVTKQDPG